MMGRIPGRQDRGRSMWTFLFLLSLLMAPVLNVHAQARYAGAQDSILAASTVNMPSDAATDTPGNVYVINGNYNEILKFTKSNGTWSSTTVGTYSDLPAASSGYYAYGTLAVDSKGIVCASFIDVAAKAAGIMKFTPDGSGAYTASTYYSVTGATTLPTFLRVDASDRVLILTETVASCGSGCIASTLGYTVSVLSSSGTMTTLYTAAYPLRAFTLDSNSTCPSYYSGLAAGGSCSFVLDFEPATIGAISGTLTLTDDSLNNSATTHVIDLSGTSVAETVATSFSIGSSSAASTAGTPSSITVTAKDASGYTVTSYTGTVAITSTDASASLPRITPLPLAMPGYTPSASLWIPRVRRK